jgi:hypothetical protein
VLLLDAARDTPHLLGQSALRPKKRPTKVQSSDRLAKAPIHKRADGYRIRNTKCTTQNANAEYEGICDCGGKACVLQYLRWFEFSRHSGHNPRCNHLRTPDTVLWSLFRSAYHADGHPAPDSSWKTHKGSIVYERIRRSDFLRNMLKPLTWKLLEY